MIVYWPTSCRRTGCFKKVHPLKLLGIFSFQFISDFNIKINLQKLVDICGYELQQIWKKFTQKDSTEVKIFLKFLEGATFLNTLYNEIFTGLHSDWELQSL